MKDSNYSFNQLNAPGIGQRLRDRRNSLNMTQATVAKTLGVTTTFVSEIEHGNRGMSLTTLYKFMQLYGLSADFILLGSGVQNLAEQEDLTRMKEKILAPLSNCGIEELALMEQIANNYINAMKKQ